MSIEQKQIKKWPKMIMSKFKKAQLSNEFKIIPCDENSLKNFYILLQLKGGHYKGQTHLLQICTHWGPSAKQMFPFVAPRIRFITQIYHPNISIKCGSICVDILSDSKAWSAQYDFNTVISSITLLLDTPNNASPLNGIAAKLYRECEKKYKTITVGAMPFCYKQKIYNECFHIYDQTTFEYTKNNKISDNILSKFHEEECDETNEITNKLLSTNISS
jgi:ubiquitin-protein ligase